jgi:hypothetical protein
MWELVADLFDMWRLHTSFDDRSFRGRAMPIPLKSCRTVLAGKVRFAAQRRRARAC